MRPQRIPVSIQAATALGLAVFAVALAIFGMYSPWGALQFPVARKFTGWLAVMAYGGTCVLPIILGGIAMLLGGHSYKSIEQFEGRLGGDGQAFFSLMIGMFAAIIGVCTTFATLVWPSI